MARKFVISEGTSRDDMRKTDRFSGCLHDDGSVITIRGLLKGKANIIVRTKYSSCTVKVTVK